MEFDDRLHLDSKKGVKSGFNFLDDDDKDVYTPVVHTSDDCSRVYSSTVQ